MAKHWITAACNVIFGGPWGGGITYNYSAVANNGRITSMTDNWGAAIETVSYEYDDLNRLKKATSTSGWSSGYEFDGFGNLETKTPLAGAVPPLSVNANEKNQIAGARL